MNEANIEYKVRGLIKTGLRLNRHRKQSVVASQLISAKNFEERAGCVLHLSYINVAAPERGPGPLLDMRSARTGGASGASVVSQDCPK